MASATFREQFAAALQSRGSRCAYVSHLKVYEFADESAPNSQHKTRYILLAQTPDQRGATLYKAKRNANGSFSIGKEWDLAGLRELVLHPDSYVTVALARSYRWQADKTQDPTEFLGSVARAYYANQGHLPICTGWSMNEDAQPPTASPAQLAPTVPPVRGASPALAHAGSPALGQVQAPVTPALASHPVASPQPISTPLAGLAPPVQPRSGSTSPQPAVPAPLASAAPRAVPDAQPTPPLRSSPAPQPNAYERKADPALDALRDESRTPSDSVHDPLALRDPLARRASRRGGLTRPPAAFAPSAAETAAARRAGGKEHDTLTHVEEMLEGFEWKGGSLSLDVHGTRRNVGTADVIEARLLEELAALESSNIHAMIESDDRVNQVLQHMDDALNYLDQLDGNMAGYKRQLNARAEDIAYIEGQNRGLQVQTSNQRVLLQEIEVMLSTVNVDSDAVRKLATADIESASDVPQLESAATTLYKSILQTRPDAQSRTAGTEIAAMTERLQQYESIANRFSSRLLQGVAGVFETEGNALLSDANALRQTSAPNATLPTHAGMEQAAGKYCGLMLYMKETSPALFEQLAAAYLRIAAHCYQVELQRVFGAWRQQLGDSARLKKGGLQREHSMLGPNRGSEVLPWEALQRIFAALVARVQDEQAFLSDLLHINDTNVTFADYMDLEPYFRHRAAVTTPIASVSAGGDMRSALEQVFGSIAPELDSFVASVGASDRVNLVGLLAETERVVRESASRPSGEFFEHALGKVLTRMHTEFSRLVDEQIRAIEQTKLSVKKRKGIVHFVRAFPALVRRIEAQLVDADDLAVRSTVNEAYERISRSMFSMLQSISNMGVAGMDEDKGQLNHYVILIENMHHVQTCVKPGTPPNAALAHVREQAQAIYTHALTGYVQSVLRRSLGKMSDFCTGIDALLQTTPANEVTLHSAYSKSAAKKLVREYTAKDMRKAVEALSKRVQKHFCEEDDSTGQSAVSAPLERDEIAEVLAQVWRASEDAYVKETERFLRILKTCYSDALHVDFTAQDVRRPFHISPPSVRKK